MDIKIQSKAAFNLVKVKPPSPSLQNDCANQQVNGGSYFNFNFLSNFPPWFPVSLPGRQRMQSTSTDCSARCNISARNVLSNAEEAANTWDAAKKPKQKKGPDPFFASWAREQRQSPYCPQTDQVRPPGSRKKTSVRTEDGEKFLISGLSRLCDSDKRVSEENPAVCLVRLKPVKRFKFSSSHNFLTHPNQHIALEFPRGSIRYGWHFPY